MKKLCMLSLAFLITCTSGWAVVTPKKSVVPFKALRKIECKMEPRRLKNRTPHHIKLRDGTSENWSGYAAAKGLKNPQVGSVSMVSGSWVVPHIASSKDDTYCSIWVGIDGYGSGSVEQLGTEHDWANGKEEHYAWFEMYPKYPKELSNFPVEPGDVISASVVYQGNDTFKLSMSNHTKSVTTEIPVKHTMSSSAKRSSAEWIVEAPATTDGVLPLAHFSTVELSECKATINGKTGSLNDGNWQSEALNMQTKKGAMKATATSPSDNGKDFSVSWKHE